MNKFFLSDGFICHQNGKKYTLQRAAADELGLDRNAISRVLNGHQKTTKDVNGNSYTFEYLRNSDKEAALLNKIQALFEDNEMSILDIAAEYKRLKHE